jgi:hypothetical protein
VIRHACLLIRMPNERDEINHRDAEDEERGECERESQRAHDVLSRRGEHVTRVNSGPTNNRKCFRRSCWLLFRQTLEEWRKSSLFLSDSSLSLSLHR